MDYSTYTRDDLIARVTELESFVRELMHQHEEEHPLHQAWGHDLSHYYWNVQRRTVLLDPKRAGVFGLDPATLADPVDFDLVLARVHPDDRDTVAASKLALVAGDFERSETEYRLQNSAGEWRWYHDRAAVTRRAEDGSPIVVSGLLFDITELHRIQEELSAANRMLARRAETDGLTGIANHRTLIERLMHELSAAERTGSTVSVVLFDIDRFKLVNDTHGHLAGDGVLADFGKILAAEIRDGDLVGRYGGEEFLVVMPSTRAERAAALAERVRRRVEAHVFPFDVRATVSAGVAEAMRGPHTELIGRADGRLYEAKHQGRNRVVGA